jgi:hypothetical protein
MNINHGLIYMNNARLVVKRVTMRILNCSVGTAWLIFTVRKGLQTLYVAVGRGKMQLLLISTLPQQGSMEFSVGNR